MLVARFIDGLAGSAFLSVAGKPLPHAKNGRQVLIQGQAAALAM